MLKFHLMSLLQPQTLLLPKLYFGIKTHQLFPLSKIKEVAEVAGHSLLLPQWKVLLPSNLIEMSLITNYLSSTSLIVTILIVVAMVDGQEMPLIGSKINQIVLKREGTILSKTIHHILARVHRANQARIGLKYKLQLA